MIGESLGPYKIIELLGAGGMGEVYVGEDTRLGRKVAIKVLPAEFASDPERLARFEQEARAAAALNPKPSLATVATVAALALLVGTALTWALMPTPAAPAQVPARFVVDLADADGGDFARPNSQVLAISPDGENLVFNKGDRLWLRRLGDLEPVELRDTGLAVSPTFSPDSRHIAFWAGGQIKRVDIAGVTPVLVGPVPGRAQGLSWADDGFIYTGGGDGKNISRIPETGGQPEIVFDFLTDTVSAYAPRLLPGGEWVLFTKVEGRAWSRAQIVAQSRITGEVRVLVDGQDGRYVSTGHLLYVRNGVLTAVHFDPGTLTVSGAPVPLLDNVRTAQGGVTGAAFYDVSDGGTLIYARKASTGIFDLVWVDREGNVEPLPIEPAGFSSDIALSPDGTRLVAAIDGEDGSRLWLYDVDRTGGQLITSMPSGLPVWSANGEWLYFAATSVADMDLWRRRADLSSPPERLLAADDFQGPSSISSDGDWLYYTNSVVGPHLDDGCAAEPAWGRFARGHSTRPARRRPDLEAVPAARRQRLQDQDVEGAAQHRHPIGLASHSGPPVPHQRRPDGCARPRPARRAPP